MVPAWVRSRWGAHPAEASLRICQPVPMTTSREKEFDDVAENPLASPTGSHGVLHGLGVRLGVLHEHRVAEFDHNLTDDELSDLIYAFQACDFDGSATIEQTELLAMINALGSVVFGDEPIPTVQLEDVMQLIPEVKADFAEWRSQHDKDTVLPPVMVLPEEYEVG